MKYKITAIVTAVCIIAVSFVFSLFTSQNEGERYLQHEKARKYTPCENECEGLCTHLPIIKIDTNNTEIPGKAILDGEEIVDYTKTEDGLNTIFARIDIVDNTDKNNHANDNSTLSSSVEIRVRGNSSRTFEKPNYLIKLRNSDGTNNPQPLLGMDAHHEWAIHGPYLDKSLIRNYMWYNLAGSIMDYSPNVRFCELLLNGEYRGLYVLTEMITAGEEGARLNLSVDRKDNTFTGYVVRLDKTQLTPQADAITPFTKYTLRTRMQHEIVYPGEKNLTPELKRSIKEDFSYFEKVLYSYDLDDEKHGYKKLIDVDSFVNYFLINEIASNYDAGWLSTYIYKNIDDKYRACVWDFNSACDLYTRPVNTKSFQFQNVLCYVMLLKDRDFTDKIIDRYYELRKTYFSDEYINNFIDNTISYLGSAIERNNEKWGYTYAKEYDLLTPTVRNPRTYDDSIVQIKDFFTKRFDWLDENIEIISQYSATSKTKKFNENAN